MNKIVKKIGKIVLITVISLGTVNVAASVGTSIWRDNGGGDTAGAIKSALASLNKPLTNKKVEEFKKTMGGVATGICHPANDAYNVNLIKQANIGWVRFDLPSESPYEIDANGNAIKDKDGNYQLTNYYKAYKERCKIFKDAGIKVMSITPYPDDVLEELGHLDMFLYGGEDYPNTFKSFVKEVSAFYATDLQGYIDCFQISNELTIDKWQGALTTEQVCYYQGELQMKSMYEITKAAGIPIGFNVCGYTLYDYPKMMCDTYGDYFDYIALDLYLGCFESSYHTTAIYDLLVRDFYNLSDKPVMINEFGYISAGQPKNAEQREQFLLENYGEEFSTEEKIKANIYGFIQKLDEVNGESPMTREATRVMNLNGGKDTDAGKQAAIDYLFGEEQIAHLYKALPDGYYLSNYNHDKEGQAKFYLDTINRLSTLPFVCGFFAYCYTDSDECYQCSGESCPVETGWGLVELGEANKEGAPYDENNVKLKPSYYAIQEAFGKIQNKNKKYN